MSFIQMPGGSMRKKTNVQKEIVFSSDDSFNSDNSFNSSIENDNNDDYKNTFFHLKEQMNQLFIANPELQQNLNFEAFDPQEEEEKAKLEEEFKKPKPENHQKAVPLPNYQTEQSHEEQVRKQKDKQQKTKSQLWNSLSRNIVQNAQQSTKIPTLETVNHRLNVYEHVIEHVNYVDLLSKESEERTSKANTGLDSPNGEAAAAKTQSAGQQLGAQQGTGSGSKAAATIKEKDGDSSDEDQNTGASQDIEYFSFRKKMQMKSKDMREQQAEKRRLNLQKKQALVSQPPEHEHQLLKKQTTIFLPKRSSTLAIPAEQPQGQQLQQQQTISNLNPTASNNNNNTQRGSITKLQSQSTKQIHPLQKQSTLVQFQISPKQESYAQSNLQHSQGSLKQFPQSLASIANLKQNNAQQEKKNFSYSKLFANNNSTNTPQSITNNAGGGGTSVNHRASMEVVKWSEESEKDGQRINNPFEEDQYKSKIGKALFQALEQSRGDKESFRRLASNTLREYAKSKKAIAKTRKFPPNLPKFTAEDSVYLNQLLPDFSSPLISSPKTDPFADLPIYRPPLHSLEAEFLAVIDTISKGSLLQTWKNQQAF